MIKRVIFYFICISIMLSGLVYCYNIYQPKNNDEFDQYKISEIYGSVYNLEQFNDYISTNPDTVLNVVFYQNDDINSQYLFKDIFPEIYLKTDLYAPILLSIFHKRQCTNRMKRWTKPICHNFPRETCKTEHRRT